MSDVYEGSRSDDDSNSSLERHRVSTSHLVAASRDDEMKPLLLALLLTHGTDAATACYGLDRASRQTQYVVRESNPFVGESCGQVVTLKVGTAVASAWAVQAVHRKGHPTLAKILTVVSITPSSIGIGFNLRAIRTLRKSHNKIGD
jgi:hypothetical protein